MFVILPYSSHRKLIYQSNMAREWAELESNLSQILPHIESTMLYDFYDSMTWNILSLTIQNLLLYLKVQPTHHLSGNRRWPAHSWMKCPQACFHRVAQAQATVLLTVQICCHASHGTVSSLRVKTVFCCMLFFMILLLKYSYLKCYSTLKYS